MALSDNRRLGEILVAEQNVPRTIIEEAIMYQNTINKRNKGAKKLGDILIETGLVSRDKVYRALATQYGMEYISANILKGLVNYKLYKSEEFYKKFTDDVGEVLSNIMKTESFPTHYIRDEDSEDENAKELIIVVTNPEKMPQVNQFTLLLQGKVKFKLLMTDNSMFNEFKLKYNAITKHELEDFSKRVRISSDDLGGDRISLDEFFKYLLCYAILEKASDIHVFPSSNGMAKIAIRKFGSLETLFYITYDLYERLLAKTKRETGSMKESIVYIPQDGRIDGVELLKNVEIRLNRPDAIVSPMYKIDENYLNYNFSKVSFRVSTYPTEPNIKMEIGKTFEKLVIRVLNLSAGLIELSELGLSMEAVKEIERIKKKTQGIVLIVGPTGSGKSTTLYSMASSINCLEKNIITFEDPVEMRQLNWTQGQRNVTADDNEEMTFDFEQANKAILRQDPDVIMMAEIRDVDTATFTINAANTGHLVLTTLHANSAASSIERLKKLSAHPLDIAMSTLCVMSQRLLKRICPHCKKPTNLTDERKEALLAVDFNIDQFPAKVYSRNPDGCPFCNHLGHVGIVAVNEIIPFTKEIRQAIIEGKSELVIRELASKKGFKTLLEDGIRKSSDGLCDIDEVINIS